MANDNHQKMTEQDLIRYSPLDQLSRKYLSHVLRDSKIVTFDAGDTLFEKEHELEFMYFLCQGKITVKNGFFSSTKIDSDSPECRHSINSLIPNGVTVKANSAGRLLLIEPKYLDRALAWSESEAREVKTLQGGNKSEARAGAAALGEKVEFDQAYFNWMTSLLEYPLFFNLPPTNITDLLEKFQRIKATKDQMIIEEGRDGDYFYLLLKGSARVLVRDGKVKVATLKPGAFFGEEALVSETLRSASIVMDEDSELARLDKESFQSLLHGPLVQYATPSEFERAQTEALEPVALLDIRSMTEFDYVPMPNCLHIPLDELREQINQLDPETTYYLTEDGGQRNEIATHILAQNNIKGVVIRRP